MAMTMTLETVHKMLNYIVEKPRTRGEIPDCHRATFSAFVSRHGRKMGLLDTARVKGEYYYVITERGKKIHTMISSVLGDIDKAEKEAIVQESEVTRMIESSN